MRRRVPPRCIATQLDRFLFTSFVHVLLLFYVLRCGRARSDSDTRHGAGGHGNLRLGRKSVFTLTVRTWDWDWDSLFCTGSAWSSRLLLSFGVGEQGSEKQDLRSWALWALLCYCTWDYTTSSLPSCGRPCTLIGPRRPPLHSHIPFIIPSA